MGRKKKLAKSGINFGHPIMIETGGDFNDNNMPNRNNKSRIRNTVPIRENTAPVPNVNALVD